MVNIPYAQMPRCIWAMEIKSWNIKKDMKIMKDYKYYVHNLVIMVYIISLFLLQISLGFPLDYMHLVCLGVMKKLLLLWRGEKRSANNKTKKN